ncbi:MAG: inositol monophosphatase [Actinomycetaceae bacterium]|nr:inositol monophosphatase [Actinomycetaceae bacterium]
MPCEGVRVQPPRLSFISEDDQRVLDSSELCHELALMARGAALACGPYLRQARLRVGEAELKVDHHDPVTVFDRQVESALAQFLGRFIPGSSMLGEEHGVQLLAGGQPRDLDGITAPDFNAHVDARSLASRVRWVVDPIDGTSNFAAGDEYFGTSIAVQLDGVTVAAAIHIPCYGRTIWGARERGWLEVEGEFFALDSAGPSSQAEATLFSYFPTSRDLKNYPQQAFSGFKVLLEGFRAVRRPGACALDLARLACGHGGAVFATQVKPWDVLAGAHLVRLSGGEVFHSVPTDAEPFRSGGVGPVVAATAAGLKAPALEQASQLLEVVYA